MLLEKAKKKFPKIRKNELLKNHCTFRIGGTADYFYELTNIEELPEIITFAEENALKYEIIGRGSNVLFTDKGFRGLIIKNLSNLIVQEDNILTADSGVLLSQILIYCLENDLTGIESLFSLPGTVGAAIWGNAGIPDLRLSDYLKSCVVFNISDGLRELKKEDIFFSYRHSSLQKNHDYVLKVVLKLKKGKIEKDFFKKINDLRKGKQPLGWSAGSFFKNPIPDKPAGYLIDKVGLKGKSIGGAQISELHGNFFMNKGEATFQQMMELADLAKEKVSQKFGINLEMEVKIIGER